MVGQTISHYRIIGKLGEGGMGEVFLAEDTKLDRKVALKFLPDFMQQDPTAEKRFLREAKSAAALDHPFICNIYEVGEEDGRSFISMEYVQGETLKDKLGRGPLPLKEALETATEIAEALEIAHKQNIVHRDLKPSNIMLTPDGHVKVMDFGLAKQLFPVRDVEGQEQTITASLTKTGATLGTLAYMSPEQLKGDEVDTRSDIFSFGIVLYEMLTGTDPFKRPRPMETASAILKEDPAPLSRYIDEVPAVLQRTVKKMLTRELGRRYQHIDDVRINLEELVTEITESSSTQVGSDSFAMTAQMSPLVTERSSRRTILLVLSSFVVGLIVGLIAMWVPNSPSAPRPLMRLTIPLPVSELVRFGDLNQVVFSPDGKHLVYAANGQLYLRSLDQLEATPIRGNEGGARTPFFSPDGQWVGFYAGRELKKVSISSGAPVTLCEASLTWGSWWSADDTIVFGQGPEGIFQVGANGGAKELLISVDSEKNESAHGPQILPDGKTILFTLRPGASTWDEAQIVVESLETGERKVLINGGRDARYVATGHLVYLQSGRLLAVAFDLGRLEVSGGPVPIVEGLARGGATSGGMGHFSVSALGSLVYVSGDEIQGPLVWVDREGREELLAVEPRSYSWPRISPDGSRLAVAVHDSGNWDVWVYDLARNIPIRLTFDSAADDRPLWTPDGQRVVFSSTRSGDYNLFWKAADGTGQVERLTTSVNYQDADSWSSNGKRLVFYETNPGTSGDIGLLSIEGEPTSKWLLQTQFNEGGAAISPDEKWVAYHSNETGRTEVYVRPFPNVEDGKWQISRDGGGSPVWGQGRELFYHTPQAMMVVRFETEPTFRPGSPQILFTGRYMSHATRHYDISPDGQQFLMIKDVGQDAEGASERRELIVVLNWFDELERLVPTE